MLADDAALEQVLDPGGALAAMTADTLHVSMSTISHALALMLTTTHAQRGVGFVGAPVFGRPDAPKRNAARPLGHAVADSPTFRLSLFSDSQEGSAASLMDGVGTFRARLARSAGHASLAPAPSQTQSVHVG